MNIQLKNIYQKLSKIIQNISNNNEIIIKLIYNNKDNINNNSMFNKIKFEGEFLN